MYYSKNDYFCANFQEHNFFDKEIMKEVSKVVKNLVLFIAIVSSLQGFAFSEGQDEGAVKGSERTVIFLRIPEHIRARNFSNVEYVFGLILRKTSWLLI